MGMLENIARELKWAIRQWLRVPLVAGAAIASLALGIGANTAIFSLFDTIVFRPLPVERPDRLVVLSRLDANGSDDSFSYPAFAQLQSQVREATDLLAYAGIGAADVSIDGRPDPAVREAALVSGNYFSTLGVSPAIGRSILPSDDAPAGAGVAVISHRLWQRRFGSAPTAVGRTLTLNGHVFAIVGVAPRGFFGTSIGEVVDLWLPLAAAPMVMDSVPGRPPLHADLGASWLRVIGRLQPGVTEAAAKPNLDRVFRNFLEQTLATDPQFDRTDVLNQRLELRDGSRGVSWVRSAFGEALAILMIVVMVVLLIACSNVTNLLIGRAVSRQREVAMRLALGARARDLFRLLFAESLVVAVIGGILGLTVALWSSRLLLTMIAPGSVSAPVEVGLDSRILLFTALISLLTALVCGLAPAIQAGRVDLVTTLKNDTRTGGGRRGAALAVKGLVVAQVAFSAFLLVNAGLFLQSFRNLMQMPRGFAAENLLLVHLDASKVDVKPEQLEPLYSLIRDRFASLPNVRAVAVSNSGFFSGSQTRVDITALGSGGDLGNVEKNAVQMEVSPAYFRTMGVDLIAGRDFTAQDLAGAPRVAILNETLARRSFGTRNPIGASIIRGKGKPLTVVGVVKDTRYRSLRRPMPSMLYASILQTERPPKGVMFNVRVDGRLTTALAELLRQEVHVVAPQMLVTEIQPMAAQLERTVTTDRLLATLSGSFGVLAIMLAGFGLYGVMSAAVSRRIREIGIRVALGAEPARLVNLVIGEALKTVAIGIGIGLVAAWMVAGVVNRFLFGLTSTDPITFIMAAFVLIIVGIIASLVPARRAVSLDPQVAIRAE